MGSIWEGIFVFACIVLFVVPVIFVYHRVYQDGFIGRLALVGIASMAAIVLLETIFGKGYGISAEVALLILSFAGFICWHLYRFHRRVLKNRRIEKADSRTVAP